LAPPDFPIGIFGVEKPSQLPALKEAGFDVAQTYRTDADFLEKLAREARRLDMKLLVPPDLLRASRPVDTSGWPLAAWYLQDEPDVSRTPPEELKNWAHEVRAKDPRRAQAFSVGQGRAVRLYGEIGDVLMVDWYPVPHLPLDSVAEQVGLAVAALPAGKPLWAIVQAFNWKDSPQGFKRGMRIGRFPTRNEIRFMAYSVIVRGARGVFFFTLKKPGGRSLLEVPEEFQAVSRVALELRAMKDVFGRGRATPLPAQLPDGMEGRCWTSGFRSYLVLLNRRTKLPLPVPDELLGGGWRPLFEVRRDAKDLLRQSGGRFLLQPSQVLVLEEFD